MVIPAVLPRYRAARTAAPSRGRGPARVPSEVFYWLVVLFTFALGTAGGDLIAERYSLGYTWALVLFAGAIALGFVFQIPPFSAFGFFLAPLYGWLVAEAASRVSNRKRGFRWRIKAGRNP